MVRILYEIDNPDQVKLNPSVLMDQVERAMKEALYAQEAEGIVYKPTGESWRAELFKEWHQAETIAPASMVVDVTKGIMDKIVRLAPDGPTVTAVADRTGPVQSL